MALVLFLLISHQPLLAHSPDTINVAYNSGVGLATTDRDVTGSAVLPALVDISDAPGFDYGTVAVGSINDHTFTLTNNGGFSATLMTGAGLAAPYAFFGGTYPGTGGTCGATLAPTASCTIVVRYNPVGVGASTDTIDISYNNGLGVVNSTRDVQGSALPPAVLAISDGPTYDFGNIAVGASATHSFTVTNTGSIAATTIANGALTLPFAFVGGAFPGTGGDCGTTLAAGASCTVVLSFTPAATALSADNLTLNYNDGAGAQVSTRAIQGTGVSPAVLTISDGPTYDYGSAVVGSSNSHTFTVTNTGGIDATTITGSGLFGSVYF